MDVGTHSVAVQATLVSLLIFIGVAFYIARRLHTTILLHCQAPPYHHSSTLPGASVPPFSYIARHLRATILLHCQAPTCHHLLNQALCRSSLVGTCQAHFLTNLFDIVHNSTTLLYDHGHPAIPMIDLYHHLPIVTGQHTHLHAGERQTLTGVALGRASSSTRCLWQRHLSSSMGCCLLGISSVQLSGSVHQLVWPCVARLV